MTLFGRSPAAARPGSAGSSLVGTLRPTVPYGRHVRPLFRLIAVVILAVLGAAPTGSIAEAAGPDRIVADAAEVLEVASVSPDGSLESDDDGPGIGPILGGLVVLGAVFAIGLSAIRRQRAEGRRSKFPPIG